MLETKTIEELQKVYAVNSAELYLSLLKKCLTNTLFEEEPEHDPESATFAFHFYNHYIKSPAITMLPKTRLNHLQHCAVDVIQREIKGDLIETGVWRGGATIFMRGILKAYDVADRAVWVADSFEGLPEPDATRFPKEAKAYHGPVMKEKFNRLASGLDEVRHNFQSFDLLDDNVKFLKGWFKDTLPTAPIQSLAIMRLDGDFYDSTMDALRNLYHKLSPGGYVIIDDYGEANWTNCKQAVDEFRHAEGISEPLIRVDFELLLLAAGPLGGVPCWIGLRWFAPRTLGADHACRRCSDPLTTPERLCSTVPTPAPDEPHPRPGGPLRSTHLTAPPPRTAATTAQQGFTRQTLVPAG